MKLALFGGAYLLAGAVLACVVHRRGTARSTDLALTLVAWPIYAPVLLLAAHATVRHAHAEVDRLLDVLAAASGGALASALPRREDILRLGEHLARLETRIVELDAVLASDEFDPERTREALREAEAHGGAVLERARAAVESVTRLNVLRVRAVRDRDELLGLCEQLRRQVTLWRFAEVPDGDLGSLVTEIVSRIEGTDAVLGVDLER